MASSTFFFLKLTIILCTAAYLHPIISAVDHHPTPTGDVVPYLLSPSTFPTDYQRMQSTFKVFPYALPPLNLTTTRRPHSSAALFHSALLSSRFVTANPAEAHLFYLPVHPDLPTRSLDRVISRARSSSPFWNRSLGADHFLLSSCSSAAAPSSARNVVELRKNAVRLSDCFSALSVPHKDVSLPPYYHRHHQEKQQHLPREIPHQQNHDQLVHSPPALLNPTPQQSHHRDHNYRYLLGVLNPEGSASVRGGAALIDGLRSDPELLLIESQPLSTGKELLQGTTRFCLFWYGSGEAAMTGLGQALASGCVPVVVTDDDRPIQDMPLMDVLRWQEIALFVGARVGPEGFKRLLNDVVAGEYERMRGLGEAAAHHFAWYDPPRPYDAFHMVIYQLWLRRHAVGYTTWEFR